MTDFRALCAELAGWIERETRKHTQDPDVLIRAYAALAAQPEPEAVGLSDEEVEAWADQQGFIRGSGDHPCGFWIADGDAGSLVRAALARWGRSAPEDGPAVPNGREPTSVAGESSNIGASYEDICHRLINDLAAARDALEAWAEYLKEDGQPTAHGFAQKEYENAREAHTRACNAMAILSRPALSSAGEVAHAAHVRRMCDIILNNTFGNEELDSLALFVGHHPDVLNASPASATGVSLEELSQILRDEWTLVSCEQTAQFLLNHPRLGPLLARSISLPAPAPAGEVAELVAALRQVSDGASACDDEETSWITARAAELLKRLDLYEKELSAVMPPDFKDWWENSKDEWPSVAAGVIENLRKREDLAWEQLGRLASSVPVPVAVADRLPQPEDCDAEGRCWMGYWESHVNGLGHLRKNMLWALEDLSMVDEYIFWLPFNALPLPSGGGGAMTQQPLRPAAQAVLDAWLGSERGERMLRDPACLAAALRAAVEQVVPEEPPTDLIYWYTQADYLREERQKMRRALLAIAAELDGTQPPSESD